MSEYQLVMPKMGEGIIEATILTWLKKEGESVHENEIILEVATDKVDSEIPSPVSGIIKKILFQEDETVAVDQAIAIIEIEGGQEIQPPTVDESKEVVATPEEEPVQQEETFSEVSQQEKQTPTPETAPQEPVTPQVEVPRDVPTTSPAFLGLSPLVRSIAQKEKVTEAELANISGSGLHGRITKEDILQYIEKRASGQISAPSDIPFQPKKQTQTSSTGTTDEIIEMDRMRKLIAKNMIESKRTSAHVSSFIEVDMTAIVQWREKYKDAFKKREGYSLTYMPIIVAAIVQAIKTYPMINISVDGDHIIKKKNINIGIATALPNGNLIVPVVKNADNKNLLGLASAISELAQKARNNQLSPQDIQGGTYSVSNIGTFGNILGTPIIPQPQVAIMAIGAITKKPVVLETSEGDVIAIRHMMYLSHTYDHRVVDGALGGMFLKQVANNLENFDISQII